MPGRIVLYAMLLIGLVIVGGCPTAEKPVITIMTHDSFAVSQGLFKDFEAENNVAVKILKSGDAGAALNQAILSRKDLWATCFTVRTTPSWGVPSRPTCSRNIPRRRWRGYRKPCSWTRPGA
ncbi:hypothetical protein [Desulfosarcina cetonica]|uniref:hypothetical protein n=1 Tax=Desulfosarcina cetonica TaxID=90730 RepID=UPI001C4934E6|nr:hypothetical protein [Desulfosarcina cetonica]